MVPIEQKDGTGALIGAGRLGDVRKLQGRIFVGLPIALPARCRACGKRKPAARLRRGLSLIVAALPA